MIKSNDHFEHCNLNYLITQVKTIKISTYQDMEELRRKLFDSIDIVIERNYTVIDQLTKLEIQAKIMGLQIISPESILTVLQMSKQELIRFILDLNLYYVNDTEETSTEDVPDTMNDTQYNMYDYQYNARNASYFYGYNDGNSDWSHSNQYYGKYYWSQQDQFQSGMYSQEHGWNQWNQ